MSHFNRNYGVYTINVIEKTRETIWIRQPSTACDHLFNRHLQECQLFHKKEEYSHFCSSAAEGVEAQSWFIIVVSSVAVRLGGSGDRGGVVLLVDYGRSHVVCVVDGSCDVLGADLTGKLLGVDDSAGNSDELRLTRHVNDCGDGLLRENGRGHYLGRYLGPHYLLGHRDGSRVELRHLLCAYDGGDALFRLCACYELSLRVREDNL